MFGLGVSILIGVYAYVYVCNTALFIYKYVKCIKHQLLSLSAKHTYKHIHVSISAQSRTHLANPIMLTQFSGVNIAARCCLHSVTNPIMPT